MPTDATNEILCAISDEVKYLYLPGIRYRKTGIVFFGLEKPGTAHQLDLFADASTPAPRQSALYKAVDALNAKYGKGKVFSARLSLRSACSLPHGSRTPARISPDELQRGVAVGDVNQGCGYAEGIGKKSWHMKRQKLTPRPTTRWDELIVVR
jgi:DNA polymerase V